MRKWNYELRETDRSCSGVTVSQPEHDQFELFKVNISILGEIIPGGVFEGSPTPENLYL